MSRDIVIGPGAGRIGVISLCLVLAACSRAPSPTPAPATASPADAAASAPAAPPRASFADVGIEELRQRGQQALREQRLYAPAGDNAIEYYLALRQASPKTDASTESALIDLQPYAVIAAEQAISRHDFTEAARLRDLIAAADPLAPSLPRISGAIETGRQALVAAARAEAAAAASAAVEPARDTPPPKLPSAPSEPVAVAAPAAKPTPVAPAPPPAPAVQAPVTAPPAKPVVAAVPAKPREAVAIRAPEPPYPPEERRFGSAGQVKASFTVLADGSVDEISVESVGTRRIAFERAVRATLKRWQFEPTGETRNVTRVFTFVP